LELASRIEHAKSSIILRISKWDRIC